MTREELEHIIRASGSITDQYEFVILGSQSILGAIPDPPAFFTMSAEADIYPLNAPELADQIDGAIGEGSDFHSARGFYAQGVGPETATLPDGWIDRVHRIQNANTDLRVGLCLSVVDLFMSKAWGRLTGSRRVHDHAGGSRRWAPRRLAGAYPRLALAAWLAGNNIARITLALHGAGATGRIGLTECERHSGPALATM